MASAALSVAFLSLSAGSTNALVPSAPATVDTTPAAEPTTAPAPDPEPSPTLAPQPDSSSDDDTNWPLIAVLIVAGAALLVALVALFSRGGSSKKSTPPRQTVTPTRQPTAQSPQVQLLSTAQWIHDQLTLELMASNPEPALARWTGERARLDNVAIGAQQQYASGAGDSWQSLAQMMSLLAGSIDTNLHLRTQSPADQQLVSESTDVVNRHRATLQQLLTAMWPLAQR